MPLLTPRPNMSKEPVAWPDKYLWRAVLCRQERAWRELVRRYRALIYRCIHQVLSTWGTALTSAASDEVYADVLFALIRNDMRKLRLYDPGRGTKLGSWIGLIAIKTTYDYLRAAGRRPALDRGDPVQGPSQRQDRTPLDELMEKERWGHLNDLLADFSDKDRTFVRLYYGLGLPADAVASHMDITRKTVYSKKHKVRAHLRRRVEGASADSPIADLITGAP